MSRRAAARRMFLLIHRWIGLVGGAVFVVIALSGGVLAFREDMDEWLNASIMRVAPQAAARPLDEIFAAALAAMPPDAKAERLTAPRHPRAAASINYMVETDDFDLSFYQLFVDPYSAKVIGRRLLQHGEDRFSQPLIPLLMTFHWTLLLGVANAFVIGGLGIAMLISVLIGVYLWRPPNGDWRRGLTIKWGASPERLLYDAHRSVGLYFSAVLAVMLVTGAAMIFKPATRAAVGRFSPLRADPDFGRSTIAPGRAPIGLDAAVAAARRVFPDGRLHWILLPSAPDGVYVVGVRSSSEPNRGKTYRNVGVDQYSGRVVTTQDRDDFTAGERVMEWLFPLHSGEAFGDLGRPFMLLIGVAPLILYATGLLRWLRKRRARRGEV